MTIGDYIRNLVESNSFHRQVERLFNAVGAIPAYRWMVLRRARQRIEYVRQHRRYWMMIELSSICNARCIMCPHTDMERPKQVMSDELFELIVSRMKDEKIQPANIDLHTMGEPLTDRKLFQRIRRLRAEFPDAKVELVTNFALATPPLIGELLSSGLDLISISVNAATSGTYRELMKLDYDRTVRNIETLLERRRALNSRLYVMLKFVICDQNRDEVSAFVRKWQKSVDKIILQRAIDWGGLVDIKGAYIGPLYPCKPLFERIVILSNGEFALCCVDTEGVTHLNVRDMPIVAAFNSEPYEQMRRVHLEGDIRSLQMCRNCWGANQNGAAWLLES